MTNIDGAQRRIHSIKRTEVRHDFSEDAANRTRVHSAFDCGVA